MDIEAIKSQRLSAALNAIAIARNVTPDQVWEISGRNENVVFATWARVRRENNARASVKPRSTLVVPIKPQRRNWEEFPPTPQEQKYLQNREYWSMIESRVSLELEPLPTERKGHRFDPR